MAQATHSLDMENYLHFFGFGAPKNRFSVIPSPFGLVSVVEAAHNWWQMASSPPVNVWLYASA